MKSLFSIFSIICILLGVSGVHAKTFVSVDGYSNGVALVGNKGPGSKDQSVRVTRAGGTIQQAAARSKFTARHVNVGASVTSTTAHADQFPTHVRAGGVFFGVARVISDTLEVGDVIPDFRVDLKVHGALSCDAEVPDPGWALANVEAFVATDLTQRFYGNGTFDAFSGFDGGVGDFSGQFTSTAKMAAIDKTLTFSLGDVVVGQKMLFLFSGSTLVSYGSDVFVNACTADFLHTDTLAPAANNAGNGSFTLTEALPVQIFFAPPSFNMSAPPATFKVYIEAEKDILDHIESGTVRLFSRIGNGGAITVNSLDAVGDKNGNGIPDRAALFDANLMRYLLLDNQVPVTGQMLTLVGGTDTGIAFMGKRSLKLGR
ncbi:MAG: hypothetical protein EPN21_17225 [Methylococcaceae bacterium]|nr:MAG: hypothetical protein EPN21_17225 [Methylococcaceae bacterium]